MAFSHMGDLGAAKFVDLEVNAAVETLITSPNEYFFGVEVDNTQNTTNVFFKIWNQTGVTLGSTLPDFVFRVDAGKKMFFPMTGGDEDTDQTSPGTVFDNTNNVSIACVTAGGTGGTTSPTNKVTATIITT